MRSDLAYILGCSKELETLGFKAKDSCCSFPFSTEMRRLILEDPVLFRLQIAIFINPSSLCQGTCLPS